MSPSTCVRRCLTIVACCCLPLLAFAGCGSSGSDSASTSGAKPSNVAPVSPDPSVAALVPSTVRAKGALTIGTDPTYPPMEFVASDGKTLVGVDIELGDALAEVMGLKAEILGGSFDGLIPGLSAGKYDVGISDFADTKEREETLDFVDYLSVGSGFYTLADGGVEISSLAELCGRSVAVQQGTIQQQDLTKQDAKCKQAGEAGINLLALPDHNAASVAVASGRAELAACGEEVADYAVLQSHGEFKRTGPRYGASPSGIAMTRESGLAKPILAALRVLMSDGVYEQILEKWQLTAAAIDQPTINGAVS
jgi:polar amino acid transport system substrate-binding protein